MKKSITNNNDEVNRRSGNCLVSQRKVGIMRIDNLLDTIEKESEVFEQLSKAIESMKDIARDYHKQGMDCDGIVQTIKDASDVRLHFSMAHSICCDA